MADYVIYHKDCGHPICVFNDRSMAERMLTNFTVIGRWGLRIRSGASDEDLVAIMRGQRCETCAFDGRVSHV